MSQMQLSDQAGTPVGHFKLEVFRKGVLIETFEEKNLIVNGAKTMLSRLLGGSVTGQSVTQISFGTNGAAPEPGNSAITAPFTKAVSSVTYPTTSSVQFNFSLAANEANGKAILEFGLLGANNTLFARKTRSTALNKEADLSLTGSWTIQF